MFRTEVLWHFPLGELLQLCDAVRLELALVDAAQIRHELDVVVGAPLRVAHLPPAADVAVGAGVGRLRQGFGAPLGVEVNMGQQPTLHKAVVRGYVGDSIFVGGGGGDDLEVFGGAALERGEQFRVHAELQDGAGAGFAREFGVVRLVVPVAEVAGAWNLDEHVREAEPVRVPLAELSEWGLDDDVGAGAHGRCSARHTVRVRYVFVAVLEAT